MDSAPPQIIARAFDDEPHVLYAVEIQPNGHHVNVCRDLPARPVIGWPIEDAFDYDVDDFQRLWETYSQGDKPALTALYAELRRQPRRFVDAIQEFKKEEQMEITDKERLDWLDAHAHKGAIHLYPYNADPPPLIEWGQLGEFLDGKTPIRDAVDAAMRDPRHFNSGDHLLARPS